MGMRAENSRALERCCSCSRCTLDVEIDLVCVCLLLQDLVQSCLRGEGGILSAHPGNRECKTGPTGDPKRPWGRNFTGDFCRFTAPLLLNEKFHL